MWLSSKLEIEKKKNLNQIPKIEFDFCPGCMGMLDERYPLIDVTEPSKQVITNGYWTEICLDCAYECSDNFLGQFFTNLLGNNVRRMIMEGMGTVERIGS